jgi:tetratricopeptide (TPR) repeat protein
MLGNGVLGWSRMSGFEESLADVTGVALRILALVGVVVALLVVMALFLGVLRSIWKVTVGKKTLVLPFPGSDRGRSVAGILAQQLPRIEEQWRILNRKVRRLQAKSGELDPDAENAVLSSLPLGEQESTGDLPMTQSEDTLAEEQRSYLVDDPQVGTALGEIAIGGVRFAPDSLFAAFHRLRGLLARRTIRGSFHEFGSMGRLSCELVWPRSVRVRSERPRDEGIETRVVISPTDTPQMLLDAVDDMALFLVLDRLRMRFGTRKVPNVSALTWRGYRAFLEGYFNHQLFALKGEFYRRERAIELYREALEAEPGYTLAHYNLATLLYNRYTASDNEEAIAHLGRAGESPDDSTHALSLAALTLAYCQQVHRFGHPTSPWGPMALVSSAEAHALRPDLAQTLFAKGFAFQIMGQASEALEWHGRVLELPGDTIDDRRMKSYANNNIGYLLIDQGDLEGASEHLRNAIDLFSGNKMAYTNLGEIQRQQGQYVEALAWYGKAIDLDPRYVSASNDTAIVYLSMAREAKSQAEAAEALQSAERWHDRAIALIPAGAHRHRAAVHERFARACRDHDYLEEARQWEGDAAYESKLLASAARRTTQPLEPSQERSVAPSGRVHED